MLLQTVLFSSGPILKRFHFVSVLLLLIWLEVLPLAGAAFSSIVIINFQLREEGFTAKLMSQFSSITTFYTNEKYSWLIGSSLLFGLIKTIFLFFTKKSESCLNRCRVNITIADRIINGTLLRQLPRENCHISTREATLRI